MKKHLYLLTALLLYACSLHAATNITTDTVSGHWTAAGSPYKIFNNIIIRANETLTIEPGVEVIFQGSYKVTVLWTSHILAQGTAAQPITFKAADTTGLSDTALAAGGWKGIDFTWTDGSSDAPFVYCNFQHIKNGQFTLLNRHVRFYNCIFTRNVHRGGGRLIKAGCNVSDTVIFDQCEFYNNRMYGQGALVDVIGGEYTHIRACSFWNNTVLAVIDAYAADHTIVADCKVRDNIQGGHSAAIGSVNVKYTKGTIRGNKIFRNTNTNCGGLVCDNSQIEINDNFICNNDCTRGFDGDLGACGLAMGGGGIRLSADDTAYHAHYTVRDNVIANNHAAFTGGALYIRNASADVYNNQIVHNTSGDEHGIDIDCAAIDFNREMDMGIINLRIKNNLFYGNKGYEAPNKYLVRFFMADTIEFVNNWLENTFYNRIETTGIPGFTILGDSLANLVGTDPKMIAPTTSAGASEDAIGRNFALQATSPCVNTGMGGTSPDATDVTGHPRIYGSGIDIGAHEYGPWTPTLTLSTTVTNIPDKALHLYPNPAGNVITVHVPTATGRLWITNALGQKVHISDIEAPITTIPVNYLPRGLYLVAWQNGATTETQKLVLE